MKLSFQSWRLAAMGITAAGLLTAPAAHAGAPMNFLESSGRQADTILPLTWGMMIISILVIVVITGLLIAPADALNDHPIFRRHRGPSDRLHGQIFA